MVKKINKNDAKRYFAVSLVNIKLSYPDLVRSLRLVETSPLGEPLGKGDGYTLTANDKLDIGISSVGFSDSKSNRMSFSLFCEMMLAINHEREHVRQYAELYKQDTPENRCMALDSLSTFGNSRYYRQNYGNMLHEIDANIEGIKSTREYFQENFPKYDVDADLCEIMYRRQSEGTYGWFTEEHKKFTSVDEMLFSMEKHKQNVMYFRPHFVYSRRGSYELPDRFEEYLENASRSFRMNWDDLSGLEQRDLIAAYRIVEHVKDKDWFPILHGDERLEFSKRRLLTVFHSCDLLKEEDDFTFS